jgi:hypothetical protein
MSGLARMEVSRVVSPRRSLVDSITIVVMLDV